MTSLVVGYSDIAISFTRDRHIDPETLEPGQVTIDIGRGSVVRTDDVHSCRMARGIFDHHHLARGQCATEVVFHNQRAIARAGEINHIQTHETPDLDATVGVMLAHAIATDGELPEGTVLTSLVSYVRAWDSGEVSFANVDELRSTLGIIAMGIGIATQQRVQDEVLGELGLDHFGQVFASDDTRNKYFRTFGERVGLERIRATSFFISGLLLNGYDAIARRGEISERDVPDYLMDMYNGAVQAMAQDLDYFAEEQGQQTFEITLTSEIPGEGTNGIKVDLSTNTVSTYFDYLYAMGVLGGVIYKENIPTFKDNGPNRDYIPDNDAIKGSKVIVAISDQAGVTVDGLDRYLSDLESAKRRELGLDDKPKSKDPFWKQGVPGRVLLSTEGTVLTQEEFIDALKGYKPAK